MKAKILQLHIETLGYGGDGIGKYENKICFVAGGIPGDIVKAEIIKEKKNFIKCKVIDIIQKSTERIDSHCKCSYNYISNSNKYCPGCVYQNLNYEKEVYYKDKQLKEFIKKFTGIEPDIVMPPLPSPVKLNYRNKITISCNNNCSGYISNDNYTIINIDKCPLAVNEINKLFIEKKNNLSLKNDKFVFRYTISDGAIYWNKDTKPKKNFLTEKIGNKEILVPLQSFFQINPNSHKRLNEELFSIAKNNKTDYLFDLYCGVGVFSLLLSDLNFKMIYASDYDKNAVATAKLNAEHHKVKNLETLCGDAKDTCKFIFSKIPANKTTLILDPPRTGVDKSLCLFLCQARPKNIIYISCGPDTLCRDLKYLVDAGYNVESARIIDMFPKTAHFETIVSLKQ